MPPLSGSAKGWNERMAIGQAVGYVAVAGLDLLAAMKRGLVARPGAPCPKVLMDARARLELAAERLAWAGDSASAEALRRLNVICESMDDLASVEAETHRLFESLYADCRRAWMILPDADLESERLGMCLVDQTHGRYISARDEALTYHVDGALDVQAHPPPEARVESVEPDAATNKGIVLAALRKARGAWVSERDLAARLAAEDRGGEVPGRTARNVIHKLIDKNGWPIETADRESDDCGWRLPVDG